MVNDYGVMVLSLFHIFYTIPDVLSMLSELEESYTPGDHSLGPNSITVIKYA